MFSSGTKQAGEISCLKWHNTHAQLTTWYGSANHRGKNKHDKVTYCSRFKF